MLAGRYGRAYMYRSQTFDLGPHIIIPDISGKKPERPGLDLSGEIPGIGIPGPAQRSGVLIGRVSRLFEENIIPRTVAAQG